MLQVLVLGVISSEFAIVESADNEDGPCLLNE